LQVVVVVGGGGGLTIVLYHVTQIHTDARPRDLGCTVALKILNHSTPSGVEAFLLLKATDKRSPMQHTGCIHLPRGLNLRNRFAPRAYHDRCSLSSKVASAEFAHNELCTSVDEQTLHVQSPCSAGYIGNRPALPIELSWI
jgi:hypothetical protein